MPSEITLSRRRLLAGVVTLGAASAASGAGTVALFSDTETGSGTLSAGTFDLVLGDGDTTSPVTFMNAGGIVPGDSGTETLVLKNAGSITGYLDVRVADVFHDAGSDGTADLADAIEVVAYVDGGGAGRTFLCPTAGRTATFSSVFVAGEIHSLDYELTGDEQATFYLEWRLPEAAGNEVQGDSIGLELEFLFSQEPLDNGTATCEQDDDEDGDDEGEEDGDEDDGEGEDDEGEEEGDDEGDVSVSTGTGTAREAIGGWNWATLGRYGVPGSSESNSDDYEVGFFKSDEGRIHAANQHSQHDWISGTTEPFSVAFNGSQVTTTVGGTAYPDKNGNTAQGVGAADVTALGVTVVAAGGSTVTAADLTLDSDEYDVDLGSLSADGAVRYAIVEFGDESLEGSFTLSGDVTLEWDGADPPAPDGLVVRVDVKTEDSDD